MSRSKRIASLFVVATLSCGGGSDSDGDEQSGVATTIGSATAMTAGSATSADAGTDSDADSGDAETFGEEDDSDPSADSGSDGSDDGTTGEMIPFEPGLCADPVPMGSPVPPGPPAYSGGACPMLQPGYNTGFTSGGLAREFALIVPNDVDDTGTYPLVFAWYHISGNAMDFVDQVSAQALADASRSIIVIPQDSGMFEATWPDTPLDIAQSGVDLALFDDLHACISQQFPINTQCVSSLGVSAGGLWTSYLATVRGQHFAANLTISGGHPSEFIGPWWPWMSPRPYAGLVLWGGPSDVLGVDFHAASLNLVGELSGSGHFVLRCEHMGGHGVPALGDGDPLRTALHFVRNHPFWLNGASPLDMGLPEFYPSYCVAL
jgi:hypothetical protein